MKKRLILGIVALAGGYLGKKYLDKQIANPNNFYDDYKDAIIGEGGKVILKGLKGTAEGLSLGYEKLFKEPKFNDELDEEAYERQIKARQNTCPHLNGQVLAPQLAQKECFALAKLSREEHFDIFFDEVEDSPLEKAQNEAKKLSKLLDEIYALESECFKTSEALRVLAKSLQRFGFDTKGLCEYSVSVSKYDLAEYGKYSLKEISLMKEHLQGAREMLMFIEKTAWLDELAQRQNAFDKLSKEDKESVSALFDEVKQIHTLITSDFVDFNIKWKATQTLIDEAKAKFVPNDEVQNAPKTEFSSNADENKPNDEA